MPSFKTLTRLSFLNDKCISVPILPKMPISPKVPNIAEFLGKNLSVILGLKGNSLYNCSRFFRYLQTLTTIATEKNSTIIFPIPIEMFKGHLDR